MNIDKAIDYIDTRAKDLEFRGYDIEAQAQRLGLDALLRIRRYRLDMNPQWFELLSGETE